MANKCFLKLLKAVDLVVVFVFVVMNVVFVALIVVTGYIMFSCGHDAAIEVSTAASNLFHNNFLIWISQYYFNAIIFQSIFVAIVFHS